MTTIVKTKRTKKEVPTCQICVEPFNKSTRLAVQCPYCHFELCRTCCETYILGETEVKCMSPECGKVWTRKHIRDIFTLVFINGTLREHREKILFDKEKALLPATQPIIEGKLQAEKIQREINAVRAQIHELHRKEGELYAQKNQALNRKSNTTNRAVFIRACPDSECRGFLSSQWKCGICEKWTCPDCHIVKGYTRDVEHTCNEDDLATARLLAADTKPCPQCATGIFKIDGCFAENTPILLWDGSTKMSQDIHIGDTLVGDDGRERTVLETTRGTDQLYEVVQTKGMKYTVNSKHTLVLKYCGDKSISWHETTQRWKVIWFDFDTKKQKSKDFTLHEYNDKDIAYISARQFVSTLKHISPIEITVEDYMKLDNTVKRNLMGYKNNGIHYSSIDVELDPYMLGIWLGDGIHSRPEIATNAQPNKDYLRTSIQVNKVQEGTYYGWEVSDNHRFILPDFTVVKNCDQMWCTQCHTAFSWRTGQIQRNVHNPHYFEWMRRTGGEVPRNPNDVPCGRNIDHYLYDTFSRLLRSSYTNSVNMRAVINNLDTTIRYAIHMLEVERPPVINYERRNENLRVQYLMKEITEKEMQDLLQRDDKRHHKNQEISEIYTLLVNTTTDILYRFMDYLIQNRENPPKIIDVSILGEINEIVDYGNECLADVAHTYACARHVVDNQLRVLRGQRAIEYIAERRAILESATEASAAV